MYCINILFTAAVIDSYQVLNYQGNMAFATATSRFALLSDDASDPFVKKVKAKSQNNAAGNAKGSVKTKKKTNTAHPANKSVSVSGNGQNQKPKNVNKSSSDSSVKTKGKVEPDWEEWEKRDNDFVKGRFESELEEAIIQSKMDFQREQDGNVGSSGTNTKGKSKKKKVPVSLTEFHEMISSGGQLGGPVNEIPSIVDEESLMEQLRFETQLELQKERVVEHERELLKSRNAQFVNGNMNHIPDSQGDKPANEEKDLIVSQLETEKHSLEEELERHKIRFKKLLDLLSDSQLKEKVHLLRDVEKLVEANQELTKLNQDLNDELKNAYSQLEIERSKAHAAIMEVKKITELSRRRNHSHTDLS